MPSGAAECSAATHHGPRARTPSRTRRRRKGRLSTRTSTDFYDSRTFVRSLRISIHEVAHSSENGSGLATTSAGGRRCLVDAISHTAEWQRLQPDAPRTFQRREEQPFTAKERGLDLADVLNVV